MSIVIFIIWLVSFVGGVVAAYFVPTNVLSLDLKFVFVGAWGSVLGVVLYTVACRKLAAAEADFSSALNAQKQIDSPRTQYLPVVNPGNPEFPPKAPAPVQNPYDAPSDLPPGAMSAKEALASLNPQKPPLFFPMDAWEPFCRDILKNRPFSEVVNSFANVLPKLSRSPAAFSICTAEPRRNSTRLFRSATIPSATIRLCRRNALVSTRAKL